MTYSIRQGLFQRILSVDSTYLSIFEVSPDPISAQSDEIGVHIRGRCLSSRTLFTNISTLSLTICAVLKKIDEDVEYLPN